MLKTLDDSKFGLSIDGAGLPTVGNAEKLGKNLGPVPTSGLWEWARHHLIPWELMLKESRGVSKFYEGFKMLDDRWFPGFKFNVDGKFLGIYLPMKLNDDVLEAIKEAGVLDRIGSMLHRGNHPQYSAAYKRIFETLISKIYNSKESLDVLYANLNKDMEKVIENSVNALKQVDKKHKPLALIHKHIEGNLKDLDKDQIEDIWFKILTENTSLAQ